VHILDAVGDIWVAAVLEGVDANAVSSKALRSFFYGRDNRSTHNKLRIQTRIDSSLVAITWIVMGVRRNKCVAWNAKTVKGETKLLD
jgi:hypothetical protein